MADIPYVATPSCPGCIERDRRIAILEAKVAELERRSNQNSHNSSRPPSSDPPGTPRVRREASPRPRGAQPGHPAHQRPLVPPDQVAHLMIAKPKRCRRCKRPLQGEDPHPQRHQVTDVVRVETAVTEVERHTLLCPECGTLTQAALPNGIPSGSFGPRLLAMLAALTGVYHVSRRNAAAILADFCEVPMSLGAVSGCEQVVSNAVAQPVGEALEFVQHQAALNADETGWREKSRRAWLWVAVTTWVSVFLVQRRRNARAARKLLGKFTGVLTSDRAKAYGHHPLDRRQLCWSHLLRTFEGFIEYGGEIGRIGKALLAEGRRMFKWWHKVRDGTLSRARFQRHMRPLERQVEALLERGAFAGERKVAATCVEILSVKDAMWTFASHEGVEPTNNAAERAVRQGVIARKISLGSQSGRGSRYVERMLTVGGTLRCQGRNVVSYLTEAITAAFNHEQPPSLLPSAELLDRLGFAR